MPASWLQLLGLVVLLFGTAFYNGSVRTFDDVEYAQIGDGAADDKDLELVSSAPPATMVSPSLMRCCSFHRLLCFILFYIF